ncbi:unnamed protein product [Sphenostylis stenocarpa]|uniref:Uncharacterized protein n=1 Tax=Sphenostylis stenocarpa TaxID=92480 RepID=A0AA86S3Z6_9FABA|nr:unnamed protein product [Sphenostylis stenocarpa]
MVPSLQKPVKATNLFTHPSYKEMVHYLVWPLLLFPMLWKEKKGSSALSQKQAKFFSRHTLKSDIEFNDKHANARDMTGIQALAELNRLSYMGLVE